MALKEEAARNDLLGSLVHSLWLIVHGSQFMAVSLQLVAHGS